MKLKIALLAVALLLAAVLALTWYARQPVSTEGATIRTVNGISLEDSSAPQYQAFVFCAGRTPVVACFLRVPAGERRAKGSEVKTLLQSEVESKMTNLARIQGEYALFAGESLDQLRPVPMHPNEFQQIFDIHTGALNNKLPFDAMDEIWAEHVAPNYLTGFDDSSPDRSLE